VSLIAVTVVGVAPMIRSRAQSPPTSYEITDLGSTFGGTESKAFAINACGQIAGYATLAGGSKRPFFRPSTSLIDLGVLSGDGIATSLNNSGYVVGYSPTNGLTDRAFIWHDDNGNNVREPAEMKELLPIGAAGAAEDINDNGKVVGWILSDGGDGGTGGFQGFTWDPNQNPNFQFISGSPAHNSPKVYGINNAGTIVGEDSDLVRGFILRNGTFIDIPAFPPGIRSTAYAVSEADHVVGKAALTTGGDFTMHAFIWTDGDGLKDLGVLSGDSRSAAYGIATVNGAVQVVGSSHALLPDLSAGPTRAFVWQDANGDGDGVGDSNEMRDLNALLSPTDASWVLQEARGINSSGQIVGFGTKNGQTRAFLLTPTDVSPSPCLPTVNVSVSPSAINEDAVGSMTYTLTRSIVTASPLIVSFATTGTAVANDYGISSVGSVTIPANIPSATVTVDPIVDTTDEPDETVILTITPDLANYTIGAQNAATGTITDDDGTPTIQITSVTAPEPSPGPSTFAFTVSLTNPSSSQITVNYATDTTGATTPATGGAGPGCGAAGVDFVNILSTGLTFLAGETSKPVNVTVCGDGDLEPDETFFVNLSGNSANSVLAANTKGTGVITPQAPIVYVEAGTENNPIPNAVAIDSVTFVRGPFRLTNEWNLTPSDRATRVILVTSPLGMTQANLATGILSIHIAGYGAIPLGNIENVGPITGVVGLNASFIIVKLPDNLPNPMPGPNNLTLTVKMGSAESNATILSITP
jgi:probable HAF family extracellular repeat protein